MPSSAKGGRLGLMSKQPCLCKPRCTTRALKRAAHGTPREFARACAQALGEISYEEFIRAVQQYKAEYYAAPEGAVA
jgi:hypothetical protein